MKKLAALLTLFSLALMVGCNNATTDGPEPVPAAPTPEGGSAAAAPAAGDAPADGETPPPATEPAPTE